MRRGTVSRVSLLVVTAGRNAFVDAILKASPAMPEPAFEIESSALDLAMGDITGDVSGKRGMVTGTANAGLVLVRTSAWYPCSGLGGIRPGAMG